MQHSNKCKATASISGKYKVFHTENYLNQEKKGVKQKLFEASFKNAFLSSGEVYISNAQLSRTSMRYDDEISCARREWKHNKIMRSVHLFTISISPEAWENQSVHGHANLVSVKMSRNVHGQAYSYCFWQMTKQRWNQCDALGEWIMSFNWQLLNSKVDLYFLVPFQGQGEANKNQAANK